MVPPGSSTSLCFCLDWQRLPLHSSSVNHDKICRSKIDGVTPPAPGAEGSS